MAPLTDSVPARMRRLRREARVAVMTVAKGHRFSTAVRWLGHGLMTDDSPTRRTEDTETSRPTGGNAGCPQAREHEASDLPCPSRGPRSKPASSRKADSKPANESASPQTATMSHAGSAVRRRCRLSWKPAARSTSKSTPNAISNQRAARSSRLRVEEGCADVNSGTCRRSNTCNADPPVEKEAELRQFAGSRDLITRNSRRPRH